MLIKFKQIVKQVIPLILTLIFIPSVFVTPSIAQTDNRQQLIDIRNNSQQAIEIKQQKIISDNEVAANTLQKIDNQANYSPEQLIFITINNQQWNELETLLKEYDQASYIDSGIVLFAKASLNKANGKYDKAIQQYQQLLHNQPDFVRARLDLAKTLFEDELISQAKNEFLLLKQDKRLPKAVQNNIQGYLLAIEDKTSVNLALAVGVGYERNINQSSETSTCLFELVNGVCGYMRRTPKSISSSAIKYEAMLSKDWQLNTHHGIHTSLVSYGTSYYVDGDDINESSDEYDFGGLTAQGSVGYRYADHNSYFNISPIFEYRKENDQRLYSATGVTLAIHQASKFKKIPINWSIQSDYKDISYIDEYQANDGKQWSVYHNLNLLIRPDRHFSINTDYIDRDNAAQSSAYKQVGIGMAYAHQWQSGIVGSTFVRHRWRDYQAYSALLQATRKDRQWAVGVDVELTNLQWQGFVPKLSYQYQKNNSNIDWLYDYSQSEVFLKFSKAF